LRTFLLLAWSLLSNRVPPGLEIQFRRPGRELNFLGFLGVTIRTPAQEHRQNDDRESDQHAGANQSLLKRDIHWGGF
jgi:hypothetical protein